MQTTYPDSIILQVWQKGTTISGMNPSQYRMDACGAIIQRDKYGDRSSQNNSGWEIDHISPQSNGGSDNLSNLRPLQWYNNVTKSDGRLTCPVKRA